MKQKPAWIAAASITLLSFSTVASVDAASSTPSAKQSQIQSNQVTWNGKPVLTVQTMIAPDPYTKRPTSWVRADYAASVIGSTGLTAHWIPGVRQLVINMPLGWTLPNDLRLPYHNPPSGQYVTIANSATIAFGPIYVKPNPAKDVYLPIAYLQQSLEKLGIHSKWSGRTWALSGQAATEHSTSPPGSVTTFQLQLANKGPMNLSLPDPPVPPAEPVKVTLPFNPLFQASDIPFPYANETVPAEDYIQTGSAEFLAKDPISSVENWFKQAFQSIGYHQSGSGSMANYKTGEFAESLSFSPKGDGTEMPPLNITVSFQTRSHDETLIQYWVTDLVLPPRPASSFIPNTVSKIEITMSSQQTGGQIRSSGSGSQTQPPSARAVDVTNAKDIADIVTAVNSLTQISPPSIHSSPANLTIDQAKLQFTLSDGSTISATAFKIGTFSYTLTVGDVPLKDPKGSVWNTLSSVMQNGQLSGQ